MFTSLPFIACTLAVIGGVIGWITASISERTRIIKPLVIMIGIIIGAAMGATTAAVVARIFDYGALTEYQLNFIYGYYFVKSAAVIGATSGAIAGGFTALVKPRI